MKLFIVFIKEACPVAEALPVAMHTQERLSAADPCRLASFSVTIHRSLVEFSYAGNKMQFR